MARTNGLATFSLEMLTAETLSNISFENLSQLKELIDNEFMRRKAEASEVLQLHILKQCSVLGISVSSLLRSVQAQGLTDGLTTKYRGPLPGEVWHGKGMHPQWLKNYLAEGHKKEEYLVEA
jgi:DNA-binding protein H-NS